MGVEYELILVEDGRPMIRGQCPELHSRYDRLIAVRLMRNFGQHNALMRVSPAGEFVVTLDDDHKTHRKRSALYSEIAATWMCGLRGVWRQTHA